MFIQRLRFKNIGMNLPWEAKKRGAMETQIQSFYFSKKSSYPITFFGYATKSLPGLDIIGLGKYGRTLKEKIIFLSRSRHLPIPLKRYVISTEMELENDSEAMKWLEFPILMLYWHLAGLLPLSRLENCLSVGHLSASGDITSRWDHALRTILEEEGLVFLSHKCPEQHLPWMEIGEVLKDIPNLRFEEHQSQ